MKNRLLPDRNNLLIVPKFFAEFIEQTGVFGISLVEYVLHKADWVIVFVTDIINKNSQIISNIKFKAVSRLIWSGGKLARRIKYLFILIMSGALFLTGGVFQKSLVEEESVDDSLFLRTNKSVILQSVAAATLESENSLPETPIEHTVVEGETIQSIGKNYGISFESIKYANNLSSNSIKTGQVLIIPPVEGTIHTVKKGDTLEKLSLRYKVPSQTIVDFNYLDAPYTLEDGMKITIPNARLPETPKYFAGNKTYDTSAYGIIPYSGGSVKGTGQFVWPLAGIISQYFSSYHPAIDIANNSGDIIAADKGVIVRAGWWQGGYGNAVQIDHGNGYVSTYAHMSSIAVSQGQEVEKGQKIGVVGSTGRSTGPHTHFTIQKEGKYINPLSVL
jgi:murein DD-endopeptidase MepM/ murein hydrolase activator NlpD